ncbi:Autophagy-related protein 13 N-terminal [Arabidopsis thaliana x Arabidopsis arenosa]|uniref:Autophagy-related protein 13 N-terminal n=1 Tax=Arabidopsis thaliana x Arabidopsis arenosa TaxID=1240361 RepID=A0A8T2B110_9BRAS|nr:Autophagy-related protein 13 N-terminal [Arabidopsis thaliana x Arabidopsis arenosa]
MSSSHNRSNNNSEGAKAEQIIFEFFAKSLHIILESRTPFMSSRNFSGDQMICSPSSSSSSSSSVRPRDKWFNLALRECPAALESFDIGRRSSLEPLVVDVVLVVRPLVGDQMNLSGKRELIRNFSGKEYQSGWNSDQDELGCETKNEQIIERWVVQYDNRKIRESVTTSSRRSSSNKLQVMYKKATLLLRSLFVMVRLLPAYKIFRELNSSGQIFKFKLVPRVPSIVEPFTRREEAEMQKFSFTPVETICGRLCLSVLYRSLSDVSCEHSTPMSPTFITDYVGSPLADPLKRFPSLPLSYGSPPLLPFQRRHSWSFDRYKASPPSVSCSPSPTRSDTHALVSHPCSHHLPPHPSDIPTGRRKESYAEEYPPSQDFSPPPSPSAPKHAVPRGITRTESAPVRIPAPTFQSKENVVAPSAHLKLSRHASLKPVRNLGPGESGAAIDKLFLYGRDDFRRHSGVKPSANSSPRISFSRSSSRSFQDDFDDPDFPCPFDVEYDDITDRNSRPGSFDHRGDIHEPLDSSGSYPKKSQDAAVGALVRMLKKAPPLRQDVSESSIPEICWNNNNSNKPAGAHEIAVASITASGITLASKTTADALEELRSYKEMKNHLLLSQSTSKPSSVTTSPFDV